MVAELQKENELKELEVKELVDQVKDLEKLLRTHDCVKELPKLIHKDSVLVIQNNE